MVELTPTGRIQIEKKTCGVVIPAPPQIACQRPQAFLQRSDEAIQRTSFADDGRDLGGRFGQHANLIGVKRSCFYGLDNEDALENSPIDEGDTEKRLIGVFP